MWKSVRARRDHREFTDVAAVCTTMVRIGAASGTPHYIVRTRAREIARRTEKFSRGTFV
jgi:hypothetical protein